MVIVSDAETMYYLQADVRSVPAESAKNLFTGLQKNLSERIFEIITCQKL